MTTGRINQVTTNEMGESKIRRTNAIPKNWFDVVFFAFRIKNVW